MKYEELKTIITLDRSKEDHYTSCFYNLQIDILENVLHTRDGSRKYFAEMRV